MIHAVPSSLQQALDALPRLDAAFSPLVSVGGDRQGVALNAIPMPKLHRLLADAAADVDGADAKLEAAYLMGSLATCLAAPLVGLALRGQRLRRAHPAGVTLIPRFVKWDEDGEAGVDQVFDVGLDDTVLAFQRDADTRGFADAVSALVTPSAWTSTLPPGC